jgi:hydroxymethylpyrimidine pyrophosphatase-like HAD family hydrolase/energy-coupling factor transporter ATP-binding protein EcfA2
MRYLALATDYDGTLAAHGRVDEPTLAALQRLLASGRKLILVTGRELPDLMSVFPHLDLFERVVAENGALLYRPATHEEKVLAPPPPEPFLQALRERGVGPFSVGRAIVATWHPHETAVLKAIRDLGLEMQVIFNKDAVMVLPSGVNKATGLKAALKELGLSPHNVVGVGDAENDHAFLSLCECSAAVDNALPMLKETADFTTRGDHGAGVAELIAEMVDTDLVEWDGRLTRHQLLLGTRADGTEVRVRPYGSSLLVAGPSGSGKSTVATAFLERLAEHRYQFCIVDPEGDYEAFEGAVVLGDGRHPPGVEEAVKLLGDATHNAVVNLIGLSVTERPSFFLALLPRLQEMRARVGRPHWLVVDEAHHLLPASWEPGSLALPPGFDRVALITVHPDQVAPAVLRLIDTVVAVGQSPEGTLGRFRAARGEGPPAGRPVTLEAGEVLFWSASAGPEPFRLRVAPARAERRRHSRKYAEGELPPDRSFYFRGPEGKLNLRAQNLMLFLQLAEGIDDDTWMYHLRRGDYSQWFREKIKDENLATEAARVEGLDAVTPAESRARIKAAVEQHYTLPAAPVLPMPGTDAAGGKA